MGGWRLESGTPQREYECSLGLVLFVIGRCTHLGMLNSICHLLDVVMCFRFDYAIDDAVISKEPYWRLNVVVYVIYV